MTSFPDSYRVQLDAYAGPLDLLLYLVKRHEIDLNDIPIARLTEQYLEHLKLLERIDVDNAGEFLLMAATLLEIKSQMLVPQVMQPDENAEQQEIDELPATDPRYELVQQLLAYKRYKDAAIALEQRHDDWTQRFAAAARDSSRPPAAHNAQPEADPADYKDDPTQTPDADNATPVEIDMEDVHILDLCEAFARILDSIGQAKVHEVTYDDTPVSLHAEDIRDRLQREGPMTLKAMFEGRTSRSEMIGLFLATLELVRQRIVKVVQQQISGDIRLELRPESEQQEDDQTQATDWRDPQTGQMQYDWPDEQSRERAEKRKKLRLARFRADKQDDAADQAHDEELEDDDTFDADQMHFDDDDLK